jgi:hypothetical protein
VFQLVNIVPKCCITALINKFCLLVEARPANDLSRPQAPDLVDPLTSSEFHFHRLTSNLRTSNVRWRPTWPGNPTIHSRSPQGGRSGGAQRSGGAWPSQTQRQATQLQLWRPGEQREGKEVSPPPPRKQRERERRGAANARRTYPQASGYISLHMYMSLHTIEILDMFLANNNNNNNNSIQFFINVPRQQPQGQLQTQHSVNKVIAIWTITTWCQSKLTGKLWWKHINTLKLAAP